MTDAVRTPADLPDEGTASALRCPICLHRYGRDVRPVVSPFAPLPADARCTECAETIPAGTRMLVGGSIGADDPNNPRWLRSASPALGAAGFALAAIALVVVVVALARAVGLLGKPNALIGPVVLLAGSGALYLLKRAAFDIAMPWLAGRGRGDRAQAGRSTWLVDAAGLHVLRIRDVRLVRDPLRACPAACRAIARPVVDEEGEHGLAIDLRAAAPAASATPKPATILCWLRDLRLMGRRWERVAPDRAKDDPDDAFVDLRMRVEDRPTTDAAAVAVEAAMAACGVHAPALESLVGQIELPEDRGERRNREIVSVCLVLPLVLMAAWVVVVSVLALTTSLAWAKPALLVSAGGVVLLSGIVAFADRAGIEPGNPEVTDEHAHQARWHAGPGVLVAVLESRERTTAAALVLKARVIDELGLMLVAKQVPEGTWVQLVRQSAELPRRIHPVAELLVAAHPEEALPAAERLLAAARGAPSQ
ncbi:MAG: hypothetical protein ACKPBA_08420 [Planctomycetota bacterium]